MILALLLATASPELDRCLNSGEAERGVTLAMADCLQAELRRADGRLNRAYGATMQRLPARRKVTLRTAQRAWLKRRDATCDKVTGPDKGTIQQLDYPSCLIDQTDKRTVWLRRYR